jgi:hypothetical protein
MGFLRFARRNRKAGPLVSRSSVVWGVRRRSGFSEVDDPRAHDGLVQHAYLAGYDVLAVCGYRPLRRRQRRAAPLAAPTALNPECPDCLAATTSATPLAPFHPYLFPAQMQASESGNPAAHEFPMWAEQAALPHRRPRRARPQRARRARKPVAVAIVFEAPEAVEREAVEAAA